MHTPKRLARCCALLVALNLSLVAFAAEPPAKAPPLVKGTKTNGVYDGDVEIWFNNRAKQAEGRFRNGEPDGQWTVWDESGTKIAEVNYQAGTFSGAVTMWYDSSTGPRVRGKLKFRGSFLDGMWEGSILTYYPNGRNRSERVYKDGEITAVYAYNQKGQSFTEQDAQRIAVEDEKSDNAFVDALDEYLRKIAGGPAAE